VKPALEKLERRDAANEVNDAGGNASTATTGKIKAPIPSASLGASRSGRLSLEVNRRPTVAIVRAMAPIGTTQSVLDDR
jgi:hypothetical protein